MGGSGRSRSPVLVTGRGAASRRVVTTTAASPIGGGGPASGPLSACLQAVPPSTTLGTWRATSQGRGVTGVRSDDCGASFYGRLTACWRSYQPYARPSKARPARVSVGQQARVLRSSRFGPAVRCPRPRRRPPDGTKRRGGRRGIPRFNLYRAAPPRADRWRARNQVERGVLAAAVPLPPVVPARTRAVERVDNDLRRHQSQDQRRSRGPAHMPEGGDHREETSYSS